MSVAEDVIANGPGGPDPDVPGPRVSRQRPRFRSWWLLPPAALVIAAAVVLTTAAATYQPVAPGEFSGPSMVPGLPKAQGTRWVNTFGDTAGDLYFPPQKGTFSISASITNTFIVTERFLAFTHTVSLPYLPDGGRLIMRTPGGHPGQKNVICAAP